jgi:hypothetical protein
LGILIEEGIELIVDQTLSNNETTFISANLKRVEQGNLATRRKAPRSACTQVSVG